MSHTQEQKNIQLDHKLVDVFREKLNLDIDYASDAQIIGFYRDYTWQSEDMGQVCAVLIRISKMKETGTDTIVSLEEPELYRHAKWWLWIHGFVPVFNKRGKATSISCSKTGKSVRLAA